MKYCLSGTAVFALIIVLLLIFYILFVLLNWWYTPEGKNLTVEQEKEKLSMMYGLNRGLCWTIVVVLVWFSISTLVLDCTGSNIFSDSGRIEGQGSKAKRTSLYRQFEGKNEESEEEDYEDYRGMNEDDDVKKYLEEGNYTLEDEED